jgi:acyl carrier protein
MKELLIQAIDTINEELHIAALEDIDDDTEIFTQLDSVAVLDLILEIEDLLQEKYGRYIQIADDKVMDASQTSFKTFKTLLLHVEDKVNG